MMKVLEKNLQFCCLEWTKGTTVEREGIEEGAREFCCVGGWLLCMESSFVYRIECCEKNFSGDDRLLRMRSLVLPLPQW